MKAITHQAICLVLICITFLPHVHAFAAVFPCDEVPCVDNVTITCEELVLTFDFIADGCCFSLSDDVDNGGCLISIEGNSAMGPCHRRERIDQFSVGENDGELTASALAGMYLQYEINGTLPDECPSSNYEIDSLSVLSALPTGTMTLENVMSEWTEQDTADWIELTETHTVDFFVENPQYGYRDILTYIKVYPNVGAIWDAEKETQTLTYLQFVSFRVLPDAQDLINSTVGEMLDVAFTTPAGHALYMASLQNSSTMALSAVSNFSFDSMEAPSNGGNSSETNADASGANLTSNTGAGEPTATPGTSSTPGSTSESAPAPAPLSSAAGLCSWARTIAVASALLMVFY